MKNCTRSVLHTKYAHRTESVAYVRCTTKIMSAAWRTEQHIEDIRLTE
jgi:hypothetical protein